MKDIDLTRHKSCFFGIQESGKTYLAKYFVRDNFKKPLVYRLNQGFDDVKCFAYQPEDIYREFPKFCQLALDLAEQGKIDVIVIDEFDLFCSQNANLNQPLNYLVLNHRHVNNEKGVALFFLSRRPQDIPAKVVESSKHNFIFKLEGKNAVERFKNLHPNIPPMIDEIDFEKHNFIHKEIGKNPEICEPIKF